MQTQAACDAPATLFSVVSLQQDILSQSSAGVLIADQETFDGNSNRAFGTDFTLATSRLPGDRNLTFGGYLFGTQTAGDFDGLAGSVLLDYPNDLWRINIRQTEIQAGVNPEMGFVGRKDIRRANGEVKIAPRPRIAGIRQLFFKVKFNYLYNRQNVLQDREFEFRLLGIDTQWGDRFELNFQPRFERLDEDFETIEGVIIPSGSYSYNQWEIQLETSDSRPISSEIKLQRGDYLTGHRASMELDCRARVGSHFSLDAAYERNDIQVSEGAFTVNEFGGRVNYDISTNLALRSFVQWNNEDNEVNLNLRFSFLPSGGSTLFLVYNCLWSKDEPGWRATDQALLLKAVYLWKL